MCVRVLTIFVALAAFAPAAVAEPPSLKEQFEKLADAGDVDAIAKLWKQNEGKTLLVIDSYLEGALKVIETTKEDAKPDLAKVAQMHKRALIGAAAADKAFDRTMFSDYTSSFVGWTRDQQKQFRAGQRAFGDARKAAKAGEHEKAREAGQRCIDLAAPLGDWWGFAMGLSARGAAEQQLGEDEKALASLSSARQIHTTLGLRSSAYRNAQAMVKLLVKLKRLPRATAVIENALSMARELSDKPGEVALLTQRAAVEEASGHSEAAAATRKKIAELEKSAEK